jgi:hypothetical protein
VALPVDLKGCALSRARDVEQCDVAVLKNVPSVATALLPRCTDQVPTLVDTAHHRELGSRNIDGLKVAIAEQEAMYSAIRGVVAANDLALRVIALAIVSTASG